MILFKKNKYYLLTFFKLQFSKVNNYNFLLSKKLFYNLKFVVFLALF